MKTINCPACGKPLTQRSGTSRYGKRLWLCSDCCIKEAFEGFFWSDKFYLHGPNGPTQPKDFNPYFLK